MSEPIESPGGWWVCRLGLLVDADWRGRSVCSLDFWVGFGQPSPPSSGIDPHPPKQVLGLLGSLRIFFDSDAACVRVESVGELPGGWTLFPDEPLLLVDADGTEVLLGVRAGEVQEFLEQNREDIGELVVRGWERLDVPLVFESAQRIPMREVAAGIDWTVPQLVPPREVGWWVGAWGFWLPEDAPLFVGGRGTVAGLGLDFVYPFPAFEGEDYPSAEAWAHWEQFPPKVLAVGGSREVLVTVGALAEPVAAERDNGFPGCYLYVEEPCREAVNVGEVEWLQVLSRVPVGDLEVQLSGWTISSVPPAPGEVVGVGPVGRPGDDLVWCGPLLSGGGV